MAKLCSSERSRTVIAYVPRGSDATFLPDAVFSEIVEPGPTVPTSFAGAASAATDTTSAPATAATKACEGSDPRPAFMVVLIDVSPFVVDWPRR